MLKINEVELAFANACTANCFICSKKRGCFNVRFMVPKVFDCAVSRMNDIDFNIIQTGGDGDSFLNHFYPSMLKRLRKEFPKKKIVLYSNFALLGAYECDLMQECVDELHTRIDSVRPHIFYASTGLDLNQVFENVDRFLRENKKVNFNIGYSNIKAYRDICRRVLNKDPYYWNEMLDSAPDDEYRAVVDRFSSLGKVTISRINRTLWAERNDPNITPDSKEKCDRGYCFENVCYIWPNGDVGICGYDDEQSKLIVGSILDQGIEEIWNSERRRKTIDDVLNRRVTLYPCINPKACKFWEGTV